MLDISIPKIVVDATSFSPSMVSSTCRLITCVTAHLSLHRGDGYCRHWQTSVEYYGQIEIECTQYCSIECQLINVQMMMNDHCIGAIDFYLIPIVELIVRTETETVNTIVHLHRLP
jgi:hypothetical protein